MHYSELFQLQVIENQLELLKAEMDFIDSHNVEVENGLAPRISDPEAPRMSSEHMLSFGGLCFHCGASFLRHSDKPARGSRFTSCLSATSEEGKCPFHTIELPH